MYAPFPGFGDSKKPFHYRFSGRKHSKFTEEYAEETVNPKKVSHKKKGTNKKQHHAEEEDGHTKVFGQNFGQFSIFKFALICIFTEYA